MNHVHRLASGLLGITMILGIPRLLHGFDHVRRKRRVVRDPNRLVDRSCSAVRARGPARRLDMVEAGRVHEAASRHRSGLRGMGQKVLGKRHLLPEHAERSRLDSPDENQSINHFK